MKAFWIWAGKLIFAHKIIAGAAAVVLATGVGAGTVAIVHRVNTPKTQTVAAIDNSSKTEKLKTEKSSSSSSSSSSAAEQSSAKEDDSADTTAETPKAPTENICNSILFN